MSNAVFENIKQGLEEAIDFSKGKNTKAVVHNIKPDDIKKIRVRVGMSQNDFASAFGISPSTLQHWEQGVRKPRGPAQVLLNVVQKEPDTIFRILRG